MWMLGVPLSRILSARQEEMNVPTLDHYTGEMVSLPEEVVVWKLGRVDLGVSKSVKNPPLSLRQRVGAMGLMIEQDNVAGSLLGIKIPEEEGQPKNILPLMRMEAGLRILTDALAGVGIQEDVNIYHLEERDGQ